jgi:hypothetical protein
MFLSLLKTTSNEELPLGRGLGFIEIIPLTPVFEMFSRGIILE